MNPSKNSFFTTGPCGVGKTTLGKFTSTDVKIHFIDHDEMKEKSNHFPYPCSVTKLNIDNCLREYFQVEGNPDRFVFAVGGDFNL